MHGRAVQLLERTKIQGDIAEFGVYQGGSLAAFGLMLKERNLNYRLFGFDTFGGMPPTEVVAGDDTDHEWDTSAFRDTSVEDVQAVLHHHNVQATLVKGVFNPNYPLSNYGIEKLAMAHVDADIYEGYRDALTLILPCLQPGTIILCDESEPVAVSRYFFGVKKHGQRAFQEWWLEHDVPLLFIHRSWTIAMYVVVDKEYLDKFGSFITLELMKDSLTEFLLPELNHASANVGKGINLQGRWIRRLVDVKAQIDALVQKHAESPDDPS